MKKNKLYEWNRPTFALGVDRVNNNIFDGENTSVINYMKQNNMLSGITLPSYSVPQVPKLSSLGINVPTGNTIKPDFFSGIGGQVINGIADTASIGIQKALSGGLSSKVGDAIGTFGRLGSQFLPGPFKALGSVSAGALSAGYNLFMGKKVDKDALQNAKSDIAYYNSFKSNARGYDNIIRPKAVKDYGNIYSGGIFKKKWANNNNAEIRNDLNTGYDFAFSSVLNNMNNIGKDTIYGLQATSAAYGGPLGITPMTGAAGIMQQNKFIEAINNRTNALAKVNTVPSTGSSFTPLSSNRFDAGGDMEGAFFDAFTKENNPMKAMMIWQNGQDALEEQAEAEANAAAQQKAMEDMQKRLLTAETNYQGLQSMYDEQARSLDAMRQTQMEAMQREASNVPASTTEVAEPVEAPVSAPMVRVSGADDYSRLIPFIKAQEAFRSNAYWLPGEPAPTIGYGFHIQYPGTNRKVKMGDKITREEADRYLVAALQGIDAELSKKVPNWNKLSNNQRDALRDLAYGTGAWGAHFKPHSRLMTALRNGDWEAAERHLISKSKSLPKYNKALLRRSRQRQNMFRNGDYSLRAFGGELGTNGTDWTNGLLEINTGGTHEDNPYDGVQLGVDQNGTPNLVEEGETIFNNYVFSKRMNVPPFMKKRFGLGGSKNDISFADASKRIVRASVERPNSPIDLAYNEYALGGLAEAQEAERMRLQAEQQNAQMAMMNAMPIDAYTEPVMQEQMPMEQIPMEMQQEAPEGYMAAYGGPLGNMYVGTGNEPNTIDLSRAVSGKNNTSLMKKIFGDNSFTQGWDKVGEFLQDPLYPVFDKLIDLSEPELEQFLNTKAGHVVMGALDKMEQAGDYISSFDDPNAIQAGKKKIGGKSFKKLINRMRRIRDRGEGKTKTLAQVRNSNRVRNTTKRGTSNLPVKANSTALATRGTTSLATRGNTSLATRGANGVARTGSTGVARNVNTGLATRAGNTALQTTTTFTPWTIGPGALALAAGAMGADYLSGQLGNDDEGNIVSQGALGIADAFGKVFNGAAGTIPKVDDPYTQWLISQLPEEGNEGGGGYGPAAAPRYGSSDDSGNAPGNTPGSNQRWIPPRSWAYSDPVTDPDILLERARMGNPVEISDEYRKVIEEDIKRNLGKGEVKTPQKKYKTWMRYAPAALSGVLSLTDALGLTNKADYTYANKLEAAADKLGYAPDIHYNPIGDYMAYNPFDRLFYANQLQANTRAVDRNLMNTSGGNRGTAQATMLANNYNAQNNLGNLYRQAEEYNLAQREKVEDFNRKTNMFNSQMALEADMANARYRQQAASARLSGLAQAAALREAIDQRTGAARTANLTNFITSLGNIGRENFVMNQINFDRSRRYKGNLDGTSYYEGTKAFGGEVERYKRNKKQGRRSR